MAKDGEEKVCCGGAAQLEHGGIMESVHGNLPVPKTGQMSEFCKRWYSTKLNGKPSQSLLITASKLFVFRKS